MFTINELREIIKTELEKDDYLEEPYKLYEPIKYILDDKGKRLRPILSLMTYNLYSDDISKALKSAIGIEIFHNYTLLHDDVMDDAELRRGRLTVHKKWNQNVAILSGDAAAIIAYKYIEYCEDKYLRKAIDNFNQVAMDVCKGQQYDMEFETRDDVSVEEYINMIYLKTSVLIAGSMRHGALIAGAPESEYNALYEVGGLIGLAFQLQDDYLDVYGNESEFGKKIGGDIVSNKKTFMLIKTLEIAGEEDKKELEYWFKLKEFDHEEKIKAVKAIYDKVNIRREVFALIDKYMEESIKMVRALDVAEDKKQNLYEIINMLSHRSN